MNNESVAVMLPVYNGEKYIEMAIKSLFAQTYPEIYPIVYNDGSTDKTREILDRLTEEHRRLTVLHCEENKGLPSADNAIRDYILSQTGHEYISWIAADDRWRRDKTQVQMEYMLEHPDVDITYTDGLYIQGDKAEEAEAPEFDPNLLTYINFVNGSSVIMKRAVLEVLDWDESLHCCEDADFWIRCHKEGFTFRRVGGFFVAKYIHGGQLSAKREREAYYHTKMCLKHSLPLEVSALRLIRLQEPTMLRGILSALLESDKTESLLSTEDY